MSVLHQLGLQWQTNNHTIQDPGTGNTFKQDNIAFGKATVGAGTYKLPDGGLPMYVHATGAVTITSEAAVTITALESGQIALLVPLTSTTWAATVLDTGVALVLPTAKFSTSSTSTLVTPTAAAFSGADNVYWQNTANGALDVTTPTAAEIIANHTGGIAGSYLLTIVNRGDNTVTVTGGDGVTISGEVGVATLTTRTYVVTTTTSAVTMTSVDKGTIET